MNSAGEFQTCVLPTALSCLQPALKGLRGQEPRLLPGCERSTQRASSRKKAQSSRFGHGPQHSHLVFQPVCPPALTSVTVVSGLSSHSTACPFILATNSYSGFKPHLELPPEKCLQLHSVPPTESDAWAPRVLWAHCEATLSWPVLLRQASPAGRTIPLLLVGLPEVFSDTCQLNTPCGESEVACELDPEGRGDRQGRTGVQKRNTAWNTATYSCCSCMSQVSGGIHLHHVLGHRNS